jgi:hypothetical protein
MRILVLALIVVVLQIIASANVHAGTLPKDPCALLTPSEIQSLDPSAKIGAGKVDSAAAPLGTQCSYSWGPRTDKWGDTILTIMVLDVSKAFAGRSPDLLEQGVLLKVKTGGPQASVISSVGDAAVFTYEERSFNAMAEAFFKGKDLYMTIQFHHGDAFTSKDKMITLLKTAAARL